MNTVRKSVLVPHSCAEMYALVEDCERYPDFLPWCSDAEVLGRDGGAVRARLGIDYHGLKTHIVTRNRGEPPERMTLELEEGPFQRFHGEWRFHPIGDAGCRVELAIEYSFSSATLEKVLGPAFGYVTETLVDRFVERAEAPQGRIRRR